MDEKRKDKAEGSGAYESDPQLEAQPPPAEFENPAGVSRGECDTGTGVDTEPGCDLEITAQVEDLVMEETKPGFGIPGYEGEEDGGG